jgi:hypothetical protein
MQNNFFKNKDKMTEKEIELDELKDIRNGPCDWVF